MVGKAAILVPEYVPFALLTVQLLANVLGKAEDGPSDWALATHLGDPDEAPGSWLVCIALHCSHLGTEPADGRPLSLPLSVTLP